MLRPVALIFTVTLSLALGTALGIPGRATAQSDRPATPGATRAAGPDFSAAGITAKLVSIARQQRAHLGEAVVLALMLQNTNTYPVLAAVVSASFTIADNKGHFIKAKQVTGITECGKGQRDLTGASGVCLDPQKTKVPEGFLQIEPDKAVVVNMDLCCSGKSATLGDTVTLSGMLAVLPQAERLGTLNPQGERSPRVINISMPLIPLP